MSFQSFGEVLALRAHNRAGRGYTYLIDGEQQEVFLSHAELDRQARSTAKVLCGRGLCHQRVILLFPPGLEFISALFGCFYAGAVAVPLAPPNPKRMQDELRRMAVLTRDSGARAVLTTQLLYRIFQSLSDVDPAFTALEFIVMEDAIVESAQSWEPPRITSEQLAFLQYTSGSTGVPKGVRVTHENLLANSAFLSSACELDETTTGVSWLPMFHDFGLIGFVLQPVFVGCSCILLSPLAFLQRPVRWLQAITRYRGTASGAPNFAFELCVRKIADKECESLELSSWRIAQCAAEPVRKSTLDRFTERFSRYGFRRTVFWPCYGLAESTLLTTGSPVERGMVTSDFSAQALEEGHARPALPGDPDRRTLVALGNAPPGSTLAIVSVATEARLPEGEVGEIWLSGPSVTAGYFGKPEQTAYTFQATLADEPGRRYLRTGDLGFLHDGELFMTGRLKDLLIIRGRNYYPQDLELTVESVSDSLRAGCSAAFSIEVNDEEAPVVVAELIPGTSGDAAAAIGAAIRQAVSERHGLSLHALYLVPPGSVPKTSSGKLQRSRCRADFLSGRLQPVWQGSALPQPAEALPKPPTSSPPIAPPAPERAAQPASGDGRSEAAIAWLYAKIGELARAVGAPLDPESPLTAYGLDSVKLVGLSGELAEQLAKPLPPTFLFDHPTLVAVVRALGETPPPESLEEPEAPLEPIAIIGMACRWPGGVETPEEYWQLLAQGRDAIAPFPHERWDVESLYDPDPVTAGKTYCRHGGFLRGIDQFDASFFSITPREAVAMDPQQRLVLETVWEAIESAQLLPAQLSHSQTGVYLGSMGSDYLLHSAAATTLQELDGYCGTGQASSVLSGRVAYTLNLQGPALTVDTACSSSLVALHLACEGLRRRECELALAGGVQVMNSPAAFVEFSRLRGLSPDGRCKSFSAKADGTGWSEGAGVLLLKRLSDARRDGNPILALVRGTAVNQDGRSQGLTAPNGPAQERVIRRALQQSGLRPADIDAIEAHGTGTRLGDPVEAGALAAVFAPGREPDRPVYLGSSKSNLGHAQAAAGVAGVMKIVLSLLHETLPKTLHAEEPSPHISWEGSGLRLLQEARPWPRGARARRAGVSSFGIAGTNAHLVLEEAPAVPEAVAESAAGTTTLLLLSAKSEGALNQAARRLGAHAQAHPELGLEELARGLATTRTHFPQRAAAVVSSRTALDTALAALSRGETPAGVVRGAVRPRGKCAFLFTGQGAQRLGMGRELYDAFPVFRQALDAACALLDRRLSRPLRAVMWAEATSSAAELLQRTAYAQPALFALEVSLYRLFESLGITPDFLIGHSVGELAAAHVAGVLSLQDACALVAARGQLMDRLPAGGAMVSVETSEAETLAVLAPYAGTVSIAAVNGPRSVVLSGAAEDVSALAALFAARGVKIRRLAVSHAFHSPLMEPMQPEFHTVARTIPHEPARLPIISTVTGELAGAELFTAEYWVAQVRRPVRFADAVRTAQAAGADTFLELGPRPTLLGLVSASAPAAEVSLLAALRGERSEPESFLLAVGGWHVQGGNVKWPALFPLSPAAARLPTYPFERQTYWRANRPEEPWGRSGTWELAGGCTEVPGQGIHHILKVGPRRQPYLKDHVVHGQIVAPGALYVSVMLAAAAQQWPDSELDLEQVEFLAALLLPSESTVELHLVVAPRPGETGMDVTVSSRPRAEAPFSLHARGIVRPAQGAPPPSLDWNPLVQDASRSVGLEEIVAGLSAMQVDWGPGWRWTTEVHVGPGVATTRIEAPAASAPRAAPLHPVLLDNAVTTSALAVEPPADGTPRLPFAISRLRWLRSPTGPVHCGARVRTAGSAGAEMVVAELTLWDQAGELAVIEGFTWRRAPKDAFLRALRREPAASPEALYRVQWQPVAAPAPAVRAEGRWLVVSSGAHEERAALAARLRALSGSCDECSAMELPTAGPAEHVVCLWNGPTEAAEALRSLSTALSVVQAAAAWPKPPRLSWLTRQAIAALPGEPVQPLGALLVGLGRAALQEHPELGLTLLDLDASSDAADALLCHLAAQDDESQVCLRAGRRLAARLVRAQAEEPAAERSLDLDGTVLVTGGLGALGLQVAGWLASRGVRHLLLVGRRGIATPDAAAAVASLQASGAQVTVAAVDVADRDALARLLADLPAELPLRGVVHAAGVLSDGLLRQETAQRLASVLSPKVLGAWNLHALTEAQNLDFFVLFSSLSGTLGAAGQGGYAAANAFLDALAAHRRARGLPGLSLAWGPWAGAGMAAALPPALAARLARQGIGLLPPTQGLALLERCWGRPEAHWIVAALDLRALRQGLGDSIPPLWRALLHSARPAATTGSWAREVTALPAERRLGAVLEIVQSEIARALSLPGPGAVERERPLQELGFDSLMAVELRTALSKRVGAPLPATLAFDYPTPAALAQHLLSLAVAQAPAAAAAPRLPPAARTEPIAVVGIGCRFPGGADSPAAFWRLLEQGIDAITEVPPERWDIDAWYNPDPAASGKMNTRWGGFLAGLEQFDPAFFQISPREAPSIDPQERLLLETAWESLEHAGILPQQISGSDTGVYMGLCGNEYQSRALADAEKIDAYSYLGTAHSAIVGRLSYWLGLKGPNLPVDTACSSSLVAIHLACQGLRAGECSLALAGGMNVVLAPEGTVYFSRLRAMSPTGRCHTFSANADGYVRGEGAGVVVLERLADARRNGHPVLALIRGTAVNQDGRSNGLTAPNGPAQTAVIREALQRGDVEPGSSGYLECHGTGTPLGDPIEVQAAAEALGAGREQPLVLGSVKSNIGHTEGAAGVAGVIKAVLSLQHARIPKSLHFTAPNPHIPWDTLPVEVAVESREWPRHGGPRRAGVSSFGFSGTNAHVVLEEALQQPAALAPPRSAELIVLSGQSQAALAAQAARLAEHVKRHPEQALGSIAYGLANTRSAMEHRLAIVATSRAGLLAQLDSAAHGQTPAGVVRRRAGVSGRPKVVFVFSGQGSQWLGMGRMLLAEEPIFREALAACDRAILAEAGFSVLAELGADAASSQLERIDVAQPLLFAMGVALAALWRSFGVEPDAVIGHSMGEVAAAHVAGALSLADAAAIICRRSRLLRRLSGQGEMAMVELSLAEAEQALKGYEDRVSVAVSNSPRSTVIAGEPAALGELLGRLEGRGVFCRRVKVDVASHSPQMEPLREELLGALAKIAPRSASVPMRSTVTGEQALGPELRAEYWAANLRQPVRFADAVQALIESEHRLFMEMSPHPILVPAIEDLRLAAAREGVAVGSLRRGQPERAELLFALGALWAQGYPVAWEKQFPAGAPRVELPTYAWQRQRYWLEATVPHGGRAAVPAHAVGHPLLGARHTLSTQTTIHLWETTLSSARLPWLSDHLVKGAVVYPGMGDLEMALAAAAEVLGTESLVIANLALVEALLLPREMETLVQAVATEEPAGQLRFQVASQQAHRGRTFFRVHARGLLRRAEPGEVPTRLELPALRARMGDSQPASQLYASMSAMGLELGPAFRGVRALWRGEDEALSRVELTEAGGATAGYLFHPALLDACLHVMVASFQDEGEDTPWVPVEVERMQLSRRPVGPLYCYVKRSVTEEAHSNRRRADLFVANAAGESVAEFRGLLFQRLAAARRAEQDGWYLGVEWESAPAPAPRRVVGRWLLLGEGEGLGAALRAELAQAGQAVAYAAQIPNSAAELRTLLGTSFAGEPPTGVVHLGGLAESERESEARRETDLLRGCQSVLYAVQALTEMGYRDAPRLFLLTRGAQAVAGGEVALMQAPLLGLARTIALEHAELRPVRLDLDPRRPAAEVVAIVTELLADDAEEEIALREGERRVARLVPRSPADSAPTKLAFIDVPHRGRAAIANNCSYLVTGGLGGLGLSVAGWLAEQGAGQLVLLSRSGLTSSAQQGAVAALEAKGARVIVARADVAEREQVAAVLRQVAASGMPLRGVVHAAGVLSDGLIKQQTIESFRTVMRPKALGALNLHELTRELPLDFFVLYSSAVGLFGSPGQGNYAAASTFLDALAHQRRMQGLPALSIDWGPFSEVGLAAAQENRGARLLSRGIQSLTPHQGLEALGRLLSGSEAQVGVVPLNLRQWGAFHQVAAASARLRKLRKDSEQESHGGGGDPELLARLAAAPTGGRAALIAEQLRGQAARVLRIPAAELDANAPLTSLGLDSLMGLELRNHLESTFGLRVPATILWTYPTLTALCEHLAGTLFPAAGGPTAPNAEVAEAAKTDPEAALLDDSQLLALLDDELALARKHGV